METVTEWFLPEVQHSGAAVTSIHHPTTWELYLSQQMVEQPGSDTLSIQVLNMVTSEQ